MTIFRGFPVVAVGLIFCFVVCSGASSCSGGSSPSTIDLTILHTNDIHGHLKAEPANSEMNPYNLGGVARLKTLVDRIRATTPNTLLIDGGDWSQGTLSYSVDAGVNMLRIMDAIGYDAAVVGNHDYLNGPSLLATRIEAAHPAFPILGANKELSNVPDHDRVAKDLPDYVILEVGGIKVGLIGLITEDITYADYFKPGVITGAQATATRIATQLHDQKLADVIVLVSHNKLATNVLWTRQVPWVNLVVSGHAHAKTPAPIVVSNGGAPAYVVEARHWGQFLGKLTLSVDTVSRRVTLKSYQLLPVTADLAEDAKIAALVEDSDKSLVRKFGKDILHDHVADCAEEMPETDGREGPLGNMLADAYRSVLGTHVGLESFDLTGIGMLPGPQSTANIYNQAPHIYGPANLMPFPEFGHTWTLKRLTMTGVDLRGLINTALLADRTGIFSWLASSGVQLVYDQQNGGATPASNILIGGVPLDDKGTYTLALHDGLLLGIRILKRELGMNIDISHLEESGIETWQALLAYSTQKSGLRAADYESGTRYRAAYADLSFYEHHVLVAPNAKRDGFVVRVTVKNEGLTASAPNHLKILRSAPNDAVHDFTDGNEVTPIGADVPLPVIAPGDRIQIELPWTNYPGPGVYGLRVKLAEDDGNPRNNNLLVHRKMPVAQ